MYRSCFTTVLFASLLFGEQAWASDRPIWERDGADWPNREASRFVKAGGLRWHVQQFGNGPVLLLVHGTGAATHSWRDLAPLLAHDFTIVAPDLPGHGFTEAGSSDHLTLPGMARALAELLRVLQLKPALAVGHSAGAAIVARMSLDRDIQPNGIVSLNGAILPLHGLPGKIFSPIAKLVVATSLPSRLFAWRASDREVVKKLLQDTGSSIDPQGVQMYARLARRPSHVAAALGMMANWDLEPLVEDLPRLTPPLALVVGAEDRSISPADSKRVQALVPTATVETLPRLGHLAHEEQPEEIAEIVVRFARSLGVLTEG